MDTKLTVRVPLHLLEKAKRYARDNNTTLTALITAYLQHITAEQEPLANAPLVRQLTGILSSNVSVADYKKHQEERYGRS